MASLHRLFVAIALGVSGATWAAEADLGPAAPASDAAPASATLDGDRLRFQPKLRFDVNKATIQPESFATLDAIAASLLAHPELTQVEIRDHMADDAAFHY